MDRAVPITVGAAARPARGGHRQEERRLALTYDLTLERLIDFDRINRKGETVERVQFPAGYALAGFGDEQQDTRAEPS